MASIEFTAFARTTEGRGASRRMRRQGKTPGIVYGGSTEPAPIELDHNALIHALRNEAFHASILTMKLNGSATKVLLRDLQMHPFRHEVLHIDFQRVDENRKIHMKVPLHFANADVSPAVKVSGAIVSHVITELAIICLPKDLPEFIEVDLSELDTGHSLHVSGVKLPAGVTAVTHGTLDPVVATAVVPKAIVETEEEVAGATEGAEAATAEAAAAVPATEGKTADTKSEKGGDKREAAKDEKKK
jgi:large subunit ribosomal protein L25